MPVLYAHDAPDFELAGVRVTGLAAPSRGATEITTARVRFEPGSALPQHRHDHEEVFTVVAGSITAVVDDEEHLAGPGDTVIVPAGHEHYVYSGHDPADLITAMPVGTTRILPDGDEAVPPWGV